MDSLRAQNLVDARYASRLDWGDIQQSLQSLVFPTEPFSPTALRLRCRQTRFRVARKGGTYLDGTKEALVTASNQSFRIFRPLAIRICLIMSTRSRPAIRWIG